MPRPRKIVWPALPSRAFNSGSLQRLPDGRLRARLPKRVDPKRTARLFAPDQVTEATDWLDSYLRPAGIAQSPTTALGDWAGLWHETYIAPIHPPNTAKWYLYALQKLAELYTTPLVDVRTAMLQRIVGKLTATIAASTIEGIVGVWRRCFDAAVEDELLRRNPARRLGVPKSAPKTASRHVTTSEVTLLGAAIVGHRFEAAYALLLGCGLRIGEVLGLSWANVDIVNHRAWIQRQYTNGHWRDLPKGRVPRWINLPPLVMRALIRHRDRQPEGSTLVMQSPYHNHGRKRRKQPVKDEPRPWSAQVVGKDLAAIVAELQMAKLTPHAARHGLASALLEGGASPAAIAERLGHADPSITLKRYIHASDEGRERVNDLIDQYLAGNDEQPQPSS